MFRVLKAQSLGERSERSRLEKPVSAELLGTTAQSPEPKDVLLAKSRGDKRRSSTGQAVHTYYAFALRHIIHMIHLASRNHRSKKLICRYE